MIVIVWAYFRLPEPTGRSYLELDLLFEHKVSARKFASTDINAFGDELSKRAAADAALKQGESPEDILDSAEKAQTEHVEKA